MKILLALAAISLPAMHMARETCWIARARQAATASLLDVGPADGRSDVYWVQVL